jgi:quinol monooxygenase YgiN
MIMKKSIFAVLAMLYAFTLSAQDIQGFVTKQMQTYPKSRLLDIYKSCFQDYMGAEHLVSDRERVKAYLDEELQTTSLDDLMPWYYEPCGLNGRYVRVSIRTIKEDLITEDVLLDAFIRSANSGKRPTVESWRDRWHMIVGTIDQMELNLPNYQQDRAFIDSILSVGKYAISHSPEYREAYRPHYRIVEKGMFENEIKPVIERLRVGELCSGIEKTMVVRIAEIEVHPQYLKEYLQAARNVGAESVKKEPGVICIFPNQMTEDENKIRIVEIYRNKEAYEHHLKTEHFQTYKQGTLHMVKSLNLVDLSPLDKEAMPLIFNKIQ